MNLPDHYKKRIQGFSKQKKDLLVSKLKYDIFSENLIAYVVAKENEVIDLAELRQFLSEKIPDYMIPQDFVVVDKIPLTENAKVNIAALPLPKLKLVDSPLLPRNEIETAIAQIWSEILNVNEISIHANFFQLGGHSLLATQVVSRMRRQFHKNIAIHSLFENPTIASLALVVGNLEETIEDELTIAPVAETTTLQLSFAQEQFWILSQIDPDSSLYNMPGGLRIEGDLDIIALEKTINAIIKRHEILRTTYSMDDSGQPCQCIAEELILSLQPVEQVTKEKIHATCLTQARTSFDLTSGPLLRFNLMQYDDKKYCLLVVMHHIIADGWSIKLFMKELSSLYPLFCQEENPFVKQHLLPAIFDVIPDLMNDIQPLTKFMHMPAYYPQKLKNYLSLKPRFWLGPKDSLSSCHFDMPHNIFVQLYGTKQWTLISPDQSKNLYYPCAELGTQFLHWSPVDIEEPDFNRFPLFKNVKPIKFIVKPGQMLFVPSSWWHHVRSLDTSISLNFFWFEIASNLSALRKYLYYRGKKMLFNKLGLTKEKEIKRVKAY